MTKFDFNQIIQINESDRVTVNWRDTANHCDLIDYELSFGLKEEGALMHKIAWESVRGQPNYRL